MTPVLLEWNGRPVRLCEIDIKTGREVRAALAEDGENGMWLLLVKAMRYADDDQPVFEGLADVLAQPFRLQSRLMRLAAQAVTVNGLDAKDEDANPQAAA